MCCGENPLFVDQGPQTSVLFWVQENQTGWFILDIFLIELLDRVCLFCCWCSGRCYCCQMGRGRQNLRGRGRLPRGWKSGMFCVEVLWNGPSSFGVSGTVKLFLNPSVNFPLDPPLCLCPPSHTSSPFLSSFFSSNILLSYIAKSHFFLGANIHPLLHEVSSQSESSLVLMEPGGKSVDSSYLWEFQKTTFTSALSSSL